MTAYTMYQGWTLREVDGLAIDGDTYSLAEIKAALASRHAAPKADPDVAAENKRLRMALECIAELKPDRERPDDYNRGWQDGRYQARNIAHTALTEPANNRSAGQTND